MVFFTVLLMEILAGCEVDLFIPSFPQLQHIFHLSPFMVELTLAVNMIAFCISSLVVGNLGDRYGRKIIILLGLLIFILGSGLCVVASEFYHLLIGRALQGMGIAGPAVLAYVIIADLYDLKEQQSLLGILNGAVTLSMAFAPVLGGYINMFFNWRGNFTLLLILGILCLVLILFYLPKSTPNHSVSVSLKEYLPIFSSAKALYYIGTICFLIAPYWIFIGMSPILYMEDMGVSLKHFGFYQGALAAIFGILSLSSGYLFQKFKIKQCFYLSLYIVATFMLMVVLLVVFNVKHPLIITLVMVSFSIGSMMPINILYPQCLEVIPEARGRIAAIITAIRLILTACGLQVVSYCYQGNFIHIGVAIICSLSIALVCCYTLLKKDYVLL